MTDYDVPRETAALRRVWAAMGCAHNPDDFKRSVRDQMWEQVIEFAEENAARNTRLDRENQELLNKLRTSEELVAVARRFRSPRIRWTNS